jgi:hypothetical protein
MENEDEKYEQRKSDYALALKIAREQVSKLNIPRKSDFLLQKQESVRWSACFEGFEDNLFVEYWLMDFANTVVSVSLKEVVFSIIHEVRALLTDAKAREIFEAEIEETEETIEDVASRFCETYLEYAPVVNYQSSFQTFKELIINYFKKKIEFDIKNAYEADGEGEKIQTVDFVPNNNLKDLIKRLPHLDLIMFRLVEQVEDEFSVVRKNAFRNRQAWLNRDARTQLPDFYEGLKERYKKAKKHYKTEYKAYFQINKRNSIEQWELHWKDVFFSEFHGLMPNRDLDSLEPSKLAYAQIAKMYDYNSEYIPKLIREQKKLASDLKNSRTVIE